ncbi:polysaccharide deacetylase family protein [Streptomyces sp. NPDC059786]|uniref:polysaccharide deacetylase family protein n=1 Tax=Streptomyces sp. NPDC059786 TaxID=3346946 RepID=UPI00364EA41E
MADASRAASADDDGGLDPHTTDPYAGSLCAVRTAHPHIVLTYDDGPDPEGTERVLAALAEHGATATFFLLLSRARRYRSFLSRLLESEHEIGLHGPDHRRLTSLPYAEVRQRTSDAKRELEDMSGREVRWFRPPYGAQTRTTWRAVTDIGLEPVLWGPEFRDWKDTPLDEHVAHARVGAVAGAIVLAHDGFAGPEDGVDDGAAPTFDRGLLTRRVLDAYREIGLHGRSLSSVLAHGTPLREARFKR